jgi:hypothetical protein
MNVITHLETIAMRSPFVLRLPSLSAADNARWTERLTGLADECGCAMGARFATAYLVAAPFLAWGAIALRHWSVLWTIVTGVVVLVATAGVGKTFGILLARMRLHRAIGELRDVVGGSHA